jgi:hypothetical protein
LHLVLVGVLVSAVAQRVLATVEAHALDMRASTDLRHRQQQASQDKFPEHFTRSSVYAALPRGRAFYNRARLEVLMTG